MAKKRRSQAAVRGTKADPDRVVPEEDSELTRMMCVLKASPSALVPGMDSKRERFTQRIFTTVQIVLIVIPIIYLGLSGYLNGGSFAMEGLRERLREEPAFLLAFITACLQPFAAYILRITYRHYSQGDFGYAGGNLLALLCAEMAMQNIVGIVGLGLLLWRTWPRITGSVGDWARERGIGGVLADISGGLAVFVLAIICFAAQTRLG